MFPDPGLPPSPDAVVRPASTASLGVLGEVPRLGLATRGNTSLPVEGVLEAVRRGVRYLNWCGRPDGLSRAVRRLGDDRGDVVVAAQLEARSAEAARRELDELLGELGVRTIDVVTHYYVERPEEWEEILGPGGAREALEEARREGRVRAIGITTHQRPLAARAAERDEVDLLMVRYNAAHTGAEREVLPVAKQRGIPVVAYTALRWGALLRSTPEDPPGFRPPPAPAWYRFVLAHPDVAVVLAAPDGEAELAEVLGLLDGAPGLDETAYRSLREHGLRVRRAAGAFP